ncbi:histone-like nucleoid-structuring protein Lsr2 [Streptomyces sp. 6N223]|uniref:histone-like nucleoid-structuring protein Lsr2 n=1 Tax=Streptomyces sp. 6N223 TaxID=3457412 RepID=UPI003FD421C7
MAQRVVVTLSDDIDGGEAAETIAFGLDGKSYEIDLSSHNAEKLRTTLAPFVQAGRKRAKSGKAFHHTEVAPDPKAVRAWAESNGMGVPARGRIPKKVYDAFNEAHSTVR